MIKDKCYVSSSSPGSGTPGGGTGGEVIVQDRRLVFLRRYASILVCSMNCQSKPLLLYLSVAIIFIQAQR